MSDVSALLNSFRDVVGTPRLNEESPVQPLQQPQPYQVESGIPTFGQQQQIPFQQPYQQPFQGGGILPMQWQQPRFNPIDIKDDHLLQLSKMSVLFQVRIVQVFNEGFRFTLLKILNRNKKRDTVLIEEYSAKENLTQDETEDLNNAQERLDRLHELETFESEISMEDFEDLLVKLKLSELKQERDAGTLQLPSTWGTTFNMVGLNLSAMLGSNMKLIGDVVKAFGK